MGDIYGLCVKYENSSTQTFLLIVDVGRVIITGEIEDAL